MSATTTAKRLSFTQDDILKLLAEAIKKKHPELSDDEFEVAFTFDSYNNVCSASVDFIPNTC